MYLNDKRFTIGMKEKKDGVDWIVDLKLTKKWKGKWEKKDGFCRVVYLKCKRLAKKKREQKRGKPSCGFEINKEYKGKAKEKDGGGTKLCIWMIRDLL